MLGIRILVQAPQRRRQVLALILLTAAGLGTGWWSGPGAAAPVTAAPPRVLVDPGHGGIDGGATVVGVREKDITLAVARLLHDELSALGLPVSMTRAEDIDLGGPAVRGRHRRDLEERLRQASAPDIGLMVSLHANSARDPTQSGVMLFYSATDPRGERVAQHLHAGLSSAGMRLHRPVGRQNLFLLRRSPVPTVLVEMGFLSHDADRHRLQDTGHQTALARALATAVRAAYHELFKPDAPGAPPG